MHLKWPFMLLLLLPVLAATLWRLRRPARKPAAWIAGVDSAAALPSYRAVRRRARILAAVQTVALLLLLAVLTCIAARPQQNIRKVDEKNARDIVFCLDASNSMTDYLPAEISAMSDITRANPTDRFSIVIFQNAPFVALPLTNDATAIRTETDYLAAIYAPNAPSNEYQVARLLGFAPSSQNDGTDIGAGLGSCVRRFDNPGQPGSRHIVIMSDMDNNGSTSQTAVANLIVKYHITLHVLAPAEAVTTTAADNPITRITGARVSNLDGSGGTKQVVASILNSILSKQKSVQYVAVDTPYPWWLAAVILAAVWSGVQLLRWRYAP